MRNVSKHEIDSASIPQLKQLCEEIRSEIFCTVSSCGGHLSSNLGVVELTVALHRVFDFPHDKIVFDVGHQCYPHKLLSGRAENFHTLRKAGGISGFQCSLKVAATFYRAIGENYTQCLTVLFLGQLLVRERRRCFLARLSEHVPTGKP